MNVDVLDLCVKTILLLINNTNSLLIVVPDDGLAVDRERNAIKEADSFLYL